VQLTLSSLPVSFRPVSLTASNLPLASALHIPVSSADLLLIASCFDCTHTTRTVCSVSVQCSAAVLLPLSLSLISNCSVVSRFVLRGLIFDAVCLSRPHLIRFAVRTLHLQYHMLTRIAVLLSCSAVTCIRVLLYAQSAFQFRIRTLAIARCFAAVCTRSPPRRVSF